MAAFFIYFPGLLILTLIGLVLGLVAMFLKGVRVQGLVGVLTSLFGPVVGGIVLEMLLDRNDPLVARIGEAIFYSACAVGPLIGLVAIQRHSFQKRAIA